MNKLTLVAMLLLAPFVLCDVSFANGMGKPPKNYATCLGNGWVALGTSNFPGNSDPKTSVVNIFGFVEPGTNSPVAFIYKTAENRLWFSAAEQNANEAQHILTRDSALSYLALKVRKDIQSGTKPSGVFEVHDHDVKRVEKVFADAGKRPYHCFSRDLVIPNINAKHH